MTGPEFTPAAQLRAICDALSHLIAFTTDALKNNAILVTAEIDDIAGEIARVSAFLVEDVGHPVGVEVELLVKAIGALDTARRHRASSLGQWEMLVGSLLSMVQGTLLSAMTLRAAAERARATA